jgi:hypothetical protein
MKTLVEVLADDGEVIHVLDPDNSSCKAACIGEYCGGCDMCLMMQAQFYGYELRDVPAEKYVRKCQNK